MSAQELLQVHDEVVAVDIIPAEVNDKDFYPPQHSVVRLIELTRQILRLVTVTELMLINPPSTADIESLSASEGVNFYKEAERFEVQLITFMLRRSGGHQRKAAKCLGLCTNQLRKELRERREVLVSMSSFGIATKLIFIVVLTNITAVNSEAGWNLRTQRTPPKEILEERFVSLGGIDQWITIRGANSANPVLLIVHGAPGDTQSSLRSVYAIYEKDFTIGVSPTSGAVGK